jgi:hypothetical protein
MGERRRDAKSTTVAIGYELLAITPSKVMPTTAAGYTAP